MQMINKNLCLKTLNTFVQNSINPILIERIPISEEDLLQDQTLRSMLFEELTGYYIEHCFDSNYKETEDGYVLNQAIHFIVSCGDVKIE